VGSYVVVVGRQAVLVDPGSEVYTARTFSGKRYVSKVLNSFGHPVPRLAGKLQTPGRTSAARVLKTDFTDKADTYSLDIAPAYRVKELKKLLRTFRYSREGAGQLVVEDEVAFSSPQEFETALITLGKWKRLSDTALVVYDSGEAVRVDIEVDGAPFTIEAETVKEDVRTKTLPTRIGIRLSRPVKAARVKLTITPTQYTTP
jgi:hypothetical protein